MTAQTAESVTGTISVSGAGMTPVANGAGVTPGPENAPATDTIESLPEWAQKVIKDLRTENMTRRQAADEARRKAEDDRLATERKWEELAGQRKQEIDRLNTIASRHNALSESLLRQIENEVAGWPEEVKSLRPGDADVEAVMAWLEKARPLVAKLRPSPPTPGVGATPRPAGSAVMADDRKLRADFERTIRRM